MHSNIESNQNYIDQEFEQDNYSFFIGGDDISLKVTRLGYGDQTINRGCFSDGNRVMHYELKKDAFLSISLDNEKKLNWSSPLAKGAYQFAMIGDELEIGIIDKLKIRETYIS